MHSWYRRSIHPTLLAPCMCSSFMLSKLSLRSHYTGGQYSWYQLTMTYLRTAIGNRLDVVLPLTMTCLSILFCRQQHWSYLHLWAKNLPQIVWCQRFSYFLHSRLPGLLPVKDNVTLVMSACTTQLLTGTLLNSVFQTPKNSVKNGYFDHLNLKWSWKCVGSTECWILFAWQHLPVIGHMVTACTLRISLSIVLQSMRLLHVERECSIRSLYLMELLKAALSNTPPTEQWEETASGPDNPIVMRTNLHCQDLTHNPLSVSLTTQSILSHLTTSWIPSLTWRPYWRIVVCITPELER